MKWNGLISGHRWFINFTRKLPLYTALTLTQQAALRLWHSLPVPLSSCDFSLNVFMERGASDLLFCESEQRQYGMSTPTHKQRASIWVKQTPSFYNRGAWSRHFFCGSQNPDWCLRRRSQEQAHHGLAGMQIKKSTAAAAAVGWWEWIFALVSGDQMKALPDEANEIALETLKFFCYHYDYYYYYFYCSYYYFEKVPLMV